MPPDAPPVNATMNETERDGRVRELLSRFSAGDVRELVLDNIRRSGAQWGKQGDGSFEGRRRG